MTTAPSPDATLQQKIAAARTLPGQPEPLCPWRNFTALFSHQATTRPDAPYLIYRDGGNREVFTYAEAFTRSCQLANFMREKLGLKAGDRIGTVAYNHPETVFITFAAWLAGLVVVPFNAGDSDDRMVFSFNNAEVKAVFAMPDLVQRVADARPELETAEYFIQIGGDPLAGFTPLTSAETCPRNAPKAEDINHTTEALIVYTSGTTGNPKGVLLEQGQVLTDAHCITDWFGFNETHTAMNVLPIHHVNGLIVTLATPLYAGGGVVLSRKFSASIYWQHVAEEGCQWGSVVPTVLSFLMEAKPENIPEHNLEFLICGAGPLTTETAQRFENTFPVKIIHGYGLSESTCYSCYLPFDLSEPRRKKWLTEMGYPSIGVPLPCNDMAIHDPEGNALEAGARGEIVIRGQNIMREYFKRPEANAETFAHGWFQSGDEGFFELDERGRPFFFITGRLKEVIIRGGVNYSPLEIDEVLARIKGVKAGMAVGFEHNMYGEEIGAYIQLEEGATLTQDDILNACQALPFPKRPKVVIFGDDFPVTATGKYQRLKLKPLFAEYQDIQFKEN